MNAYGQFYVISGTSPAGAETVAETTQLIGLGDFRSLTVYANIAGGTGGVLDLYLQKAFVNPTDGVTTWIDFVHFPQLAAGIARTTKVLGLTRATGSGTTPSAIGINTSPVLAANTIVEGDFGDRMRLLYVAGASTSAGTTQTIGIYASV